MTGVRARRGFTLAELLVAMTISTTVMMGAVAAIGIGGRAFRSATQGLESTHAMDGLSRMVADIERAIHFDELTATAVGFYVPDRTGDGAPDHLRYAWSGVSGDPVTLSLNGSAEASVIEAVEDASFDLVVATVVGDPVWVSPPPSDVVAFNRGYSGSPASTFTVDDGVSVAAIVQPTSPGGAATFRVTRVIITMSEPAGRDCDVVVSIHQVNGGFGTPMATALASATIRKQDLPTTAGPVQVTFASPPTFNDGDFVAVVLSSAEAKPSADVPLEASPGFLTDGWVATSASAGSWSINGTRDMALTLYALAGSS